MTAPAACSGGGEGFCGNWGGLGPRFRARSSPTPAVLAEAEPWPHFRAPAGLQQSTVAMPGPSEDPTGPVLSAPEGRFAGSVSRGLPWGAAGSGLPRPLTVLRQLPMPASGMATGRKGWKRPRGAGGVASGSGGSLPPLRLPAGFDSRHPRDLILIGPSCQLRLFEPQPGRGNSHAPVHPEVMQLSDIVNSISRPFGSSTRSR